MVAYVKIDSHLNFYDDWVYTAYSGFINRGMKVVKYNNLNIVPDNPKNIILVGPIDDTIEYFKRNNIIVPEALNIPTCLYPFCKRYVRKGIINDFVKSNDLGLPVFVKPLELKKFSAGVLTKQKSIDTFFKDLDPTTPALWSSYLDIISEYRGFVLERQLVGLKHYAGDFDILPSISEIRNAISAYKDQPKAYTIDFGITNGEQTVLIECNDAWSIGSYGLDPIIYTNILLKRWFEIVK